MTYEVIIIEEIRSSTRATFHIIRKFEFKIGNDRQKIFSYEHRFYDLTDDGNLSLAISQKRTKIKFIHSRVNIQ